jgi:dihydrofolate reductase
MDVRHPVVDEMPAASPAAPAASTTPSPGCTSPGSAPRSWVPEVRPARMARGPEWKGWWGPNPPFHTPVFVLTHHPRPSIEMEGGTTFHFIDASPAEALETAREAAGGQDVRIGGGPTVIRDFLAAGLVDHMHIVVVPILLGRGVRLWDGLEGLEKDYEVEAVSSPSGVTHLTFTRRRVTSAGRRTFTTPTLAAQSEGTPSRFRSIRSRPLGSGPNGCPRLIAVNRYMASPPRMPPAALDLARLVRARRRGFLWISRPDSRHSRNLAERPELALVIYDSTVRPAERQALYVEAVAEQLDGERRDAAVARFSEHSVADDLEPLSIDAVTGERPVPDVPRRRHGQRSCSRTSGTAASPVEALEGCSPGPSGPPSSSAPSGRSNHPLGRAHTHGRASLVDGGTPAARRVRTRNLWEAELGRSLRASRDAPDASTHEHFRPVAVALP